MAERGARRGLAHASPTRRRWRKSAASARRCSRAISRPSGRSSSSRATISSTRCSALGGELRRHSLCAGLAGLFADLVRLRQAAPHRQSAHARSRVRLRRRAIRARDRGGRAARMSRLSSSRIRARRQLDRRLPRRPPTRRTRASRPDTIAKFLFTSGSTGMPKGVINTQRMWCSNQAMIATRAAVLRGRAAGDRRLGAVASHRRRQSRCRAGASTTAARCISTAASRCPGAIEETVRNLREIAPTWYFTVPKGYEALLPFFRADAALRENFFSRLKVLWFAGAGLAQHVFDEWKEHGATAPAARTSCSSPASARPRPRPTRSAACGTPRTPTNIGLPPPGLDVKLVPLATANTRRGCKGPSITPGYWREPKLTAEAFDEEGFYKLGDALRFDDPAQPEKGLLFEGRIAEDFKLATGTWVSVGPLRVALHRALRAVRERRGDRGRRPRLHRGADLPRSRRLPPPCARSAEGRERCRHRRARGRAARIPFPARQLRQSMRPARPTASCVRCCSTRRPRSMSARRPTRARSTSAWC